MIKIIKEIRVEVSKPNLFQAIVAKQYDMNSRYLKATFVNDGVVLPIVKTSSVLVSINAKRSDGESRAFYGEVNDDNTVLVPIDSWMLSLDGEVTCDISVIEVDASTNVEKRLTSTTFTLLVERAVFNIDDGEISDEEQENFINGLIIECQTATAAANAVATECREFIDANALKINKTGAIVSANDVSPVEHDLKVSVASKNLLPYPYAQTTRTQNGITFTDNGDGSITINGTATSQTYFGVVATTSSLKLEKGKTYTLSGFPTGYNISTAYLNIRNTTYEQHIRCSGDSVTFTAEYTDYYSQIYINSGVTLDNVVVRPQLEEGSTATEYTPYVADLTAVNVTRCGKNLCPTATISSAQQVQGKVRIDGLSHGTYTASADVTRYADDNVTYARFSLTAYYTDGTTTNKSTTLDTGNTEADGVARKKTATITTNPEKTLLYIEIRALDYGSLTGPKTRNAKAENIQLEISDTATTFEQYSGQTATPNADGIVEGLTSISPNMTVFADKGVNIDLTYIADTKMYIDNKFAELQAAIISLGGNV